MTIIDISPRLSSDIDVWPGDVPYRPKKSMRIDDGAHMDLGSLETTYHVGAHLDAPNHFHQGGADAAGIPLDACFGPCQVIGVDVGRGERITPAHLAEPVSAPRVLFKTGTFPDPQTWNNDFAALSRPLIDHLAACGVRLVGIDTPSIDLFHDKALEAHHAVAEFGLVNLEGIVLDHVEPGTYTLCALPLPLVGADASPVRAVLMPPSATGM